MKRKGFKSWIERQLSLFLDSALSMSPNLVSSINRKCLFYS